MNAISVGFEIVIHAEIDAVWDCLVNKTSKWWSRDFYTNPKTKGFYIESRIGGRAYEDFGQGEGFVWSEVIGVDSPNAIHMKGLLAPAFGGPAISYISIHLQADGASTILKLSDALLGAVSEKGAAQIEAGWKMIYGEAFKHYVESSTSKP